MEEEGSSEGVSSSAYGGGRLVRGGRLVAHGRFLGSEGQDFAVKAILGRAIEVGTIKAESGSAYGRRIYHGSS